MIHAVVVAVGVVTALLLGRAARRSPTRARARAASVRRGWRLPARARGPIERALRDADLALDPEAALRLLGATVGVVAVVGAVVAPSLVLPGVVTTLVAAPVGLLVARRRSRRAFLLALPGFVEETAARLRAGYPVAAALHAAAEAGGPVGADLRRLDRRVALGAPLAEALGAWARERDLDAGRAVAGALVVAAATGGAAASALDGLARSLRDQQAARADAAAWSAQSRLSAVVVGLAPVGFLAFSAIADPHAVTVLVSTGVGRLCLVAGLSFDALGAWWMHRIATSPP
ncbi:MAG: type II secretion system F family protein [Actinomycetes bacterium]